jgi:hypothetical protein
LTQEIKTIIREFLNPPLKVSQKTLKKYEEIDLTPPPALKFDKERSKFKK